MNEWAQLTASDGHILDAYVTEPKGAPIAGLIVLQEIFDVNAHIRSVADGCTSDGFFVVAPALFDRIKKHVDLQYESEDLQKAMSFIPKLNIEKALFRRCSRTRNRRDRLLFRRNCRVAERNTSENRCHCRVLCRSHRKLCRRNSESPGDAAFRQARYSAKLARE